jgi:hypothetical protein
MRIAAQDDMLPALRHAIPRARNVRRCKKFGRRRGAMQSLVPEALAKGWTPACDHACANPFTDVSGTMDRMPRCRRSTHD